MRIQLGMENGDSRATIRLAPSLHPWLAAMAVAALAVVFPLQVRAVTNVLFSITQTTNLVATNINSDTIETAGYLFTLSRNDSIEP
jgi:hypothetical protein